MTCVIPSQSHILSLFLMPVIQCIVAQWRHISSESAVALLLHPCSICSHILIFVAKCDAQSKAWDILLVLTFVAGNLCNKCPSGYLNKTAVKVILSMRSLVSIEQQSPRRPCDITPVLKQSSTEDVRVVQWSQTTPHHQPTLVPATFNIWQKKKYYKGWIILLL